MFLQFDDAAAKVKSLKSSPTNDELLQLYALYKQVGQWKNEFIYEQRLDFAIILEVEFVKRRMILQGTAGDNTTAAPGMFDLKGKAKWNAWNEKKG